MIGGVGEMGKYSCRILAAADEVDEVIIADRDAEKAARRAAEIGAKAPPTLDLSDKQALASALAD